MVAKQGVDFFPALSGTCLRHGCQLIEEETVLTAEIDRTRRMLELRGPELASGPGES
jgi:hypothetical protein